MLASSSTRAESTTISAKLTRRQAGPQRLPVATALRCGGHWLPHASPAATQSAVRQHSSCVPVCPRRSATLGWEAAYCRVRVRAPSVSARLATPETLYLFPLPLIYALVAASVFLATLRRVSCVATRTASPCSTRYAKAMPNSLRNLESELDVSQSANGASIASNSRTPNGSAQMTTPRNSPYIAIVGAGMAGLRAARSLLQSGYRVAVLESRDRIGGRICTSDGLGKDVDL